MRIVQSGLAAVPIILLAAFARCAEPNWAVDVPLESCDGIPCIEATVGVGAAGRYIIDTGDNISVVDTADAKEIGFGPENMKDGQIAKAAHATVTIGNVAMEGAPFIPLALTDYIKKGTLPHARGSLTYTVFRDRIIQLDFVRHRFRVSEPLVAAVACDGFCAKLDLIKFGKKGPPILVGEGFTADGKTIRAQIDTCYTGGLLIYTAAIKPLGLTVSPSAAKVAFPFTDDNVNMLRSGDADVHFGRVALGRVPLYFPTPGVHEPDGYFESTIGLAALKSSILTLDLHDQTVRLERRG